MERLQSALNINRNIMTNLAEVIKFPLKPSVDFINREAGKLIGKFGWVYVLTNDSMPDIVKIGYTTQSPYLRAKQLSKATGVPQPFEVSYALTTMMFSELEARAHFLLSDYRVNDNREFFYQTPKDAYDLLIKLSGQVVSCFCSSKFKTDIYSAALEMANFEHDGCIEDNDSFDLDEIV